MFNAEERFAYMESQKHYWDNKNTLDYAYEKGKDAGLEEGLAEGEFKAKIETARKMSSMGMDMETVLEVIGLPKEELAQKVEP